jgi:hypothetical protein
MCLPNWHRQRQKGLYMSMIMLLPLDPSLLAILAVWRVTHLLWGEDGPGEIFAHLRRLVGRSVFGRLLDCFYCLSLWVAIPFALVLGVTWVERGLLWFGLSGGAIILNHVTSLRSSPPPPATWYEEALPESQKSE